MKKTLIFLITLVLSLNLAVPPLHAQKEETIKVGVFNGFGASEGCVTDTMEALKIDPAIIPVEISANDILTGHLEEIDVLVFAGGSGSRQKSNLGDLAGQKVMDFVRKPETFDTHTPSGDSVSNRRSKSSAGTERICMALPLD